MKGLGEFATKWNQMHNGVKDEIIPEPNAQEYESESTQQINGEKVKKTFKVICSILYHLRKVIMAIPVVFYAMKIASYNMETLPEMVGVNLLANGNFAEMISRNTAVYGCLGITGGCLFLMFLSRKTLYPWIISIFSLVLPILLLVINVYPA